MIYIKLLPGEKNDIIRALEDVLEYVKQDKKYDETKRIPKKMKIQEIEHLLEVIDKDREEKILLSKGVYMREEINDARH